ncbi:MAG: FhaA domain-containing protein [Actinomycetota bacterium]
MGFLRRIESRLEGVFEGGIGRTFRSHVQPVELARKLAKEMDDHKVISVSQVYVPNVYTVFLAPADREQFLAYEARLRTELAGYLTEHARREGYALPGRARVLIETADELDVGTFGIAAEMEETPPPVASDAPPPGVSLPEEFEAAPAAPATPAAPVAAAAAAPPPPSAAPVVDPFSDEDPLATAAPAAAAPAAPPPPPAPAAVDRWVLVWPAGEVPIGDAAIVIGRSKDCDISLADGNVSRRHAEFGRDGEGFAIRDLDSTNGTLVNGRRIRREPVGEGDEITVGTSTLRIERRPG